MRKNSKSSEDQGNNHGTHAPLVFLVLIAEVSVELGVEADESNGVERSSSEPLVVAGLEIIGIIRHGES